VTHHHSAGALGEFEHRSHYHLHEHTTLSSFTPIATAARPTSRQTMTARHTSTTTTRRRERTITSPSSRRRSREAHHNGIRVRRLEGEYLPGWRPSWHRRAIGRDIRSRRHPATAAHSSSTSRAAEAPRRSARPHRGNAPNTPRSILLWRMTRQFADAAAALRAAGYCILEAGDGPEALEVAAVMPRLTSWSAMS
jgi:hypothetical protein